MLTNEDRAEFALHAVHAFRKVCGGSPSDMEEAVHDLLCNIAHLCRAEGITPKTAFANALATYRDECDEEGPPVKRGALATHPLRNF
jgi:hypothetical protein